MGVVVAETVMVDKELRSDPHGGDLDRRSRRHRRSRVTVHNHIDADADDAYHFSVRKSTHDEHDCLMSCLFVSAA